MLRDEFRFDNDEHRKLFSIIASVYPFVSHIQFMQDSVVLISYCSNSDWDKLYDIAQRIRQLTAENAQLKVQHLISTIGDIDYLGI